MFGLILFGNIVQLLPYILLSVNTLESAGLGRKLKDSHWQRGRFKIKQIESCNPLSGERQVIYEAGKPLVGVPTLSITVAEVQERAATLPTEKVTLNFLTPTRIVDQEHLVRHAEFRPLIHRLLERLGSLEEEYGVGDGRIIGEQQKFVELAESVKCVDDATHWEELQSYSHRQRRMTPISGLLGKATFVGDMAPFRELLAWGELVHVGKSAVKGNGWYKIEN